MTPEHFIALWQNNKLTERAGAQAHFDDLCELLGVAKPRDPDNYCFERGAKKSGGGDGWADVWKRGHFAWENKKPGRDLDRALKQLTDYALQLESPPLLVVCDRERIIIHTAFTGYPDEPREIRITDLRDEGVRQTLRWVFTDPQKLRPEKSSAAITEEAARTFATLAEDMRKRGQDHETVAHFLVQCLFCMFAEDEGLLPHTVFTQLLANAGNDADKAARRIEKLFAAMGESGGEYGDHDIAWFNGGLFKTIAAPELTLGDLQTLRSAAADMDWRAIDPTIFGTLFERGLGDKRAPLGAHYTDTGTIAKLVDPLVREPLLREWQDTCAKMVSKKKPKDQEKLYQAFLLRLNQFRVLDPACGSGNFLYLSLKALRDVEKHAAVQAQELGLQAEVTMQTGPHNILGLEINEFAAELARVTVWIGDIQWCRQNGWPHSLNPILKPLDGIENRDALLTFQNAKAPSSGAARHLPPEGEGKADAFPSPFGRRCPEGADEGAVEAQWPPADVIVGNPPFIGDKKMRGELGDEYVETLRKTFEGRVPGGADFVCYWFEKARAQIESGQLQAAGLVSTNSIRGGANRKVLERIIESSRIFVAWSDEPWVNDGAAVRVSMVGFGERDGAVLNDKKVVEIFADLEAGDGLNLSQAIALPENAGTAFSGITKKGPFDISGDEAREVLSVGGNPNGRPNSDVVLPWRNGESVVGRDADKWIINFGELMQEDASFYDSPFAIVASRVKPKRDQSNDKNERANWWKLARRAPAMFSRIANLQRFIVTPEVSKHRVFAFAVPPVVPDKNLAVIARSDDATFGVLHSRFHEIWALRMGSSLENRPRYTSTTCFETFPFPEGLTPNLAASDCADSPHAIAIAEAAKKLNELRNNWLNPTDWVDWLRTPEEERADFPLRPVAKPGFEVELKKRTLTNLYNQRPAWLSLALDKAVATAYGWEWPLSDEEILRRLFALNQQRVAP